MARNPLLDIWRERPVEGSGGGPGGGTGSTAGFAYSVNGRALGGEPIATATHFAVKQTIAGCDYVTFQPWDPGDQTITESNGFKFLNMAGTPGIGSYRGLYLRKDPIDGVTRLSSYPPPPAERIWVSKVSGKFELSSTRTEQAVGVVQPRGTARLIAET